LDGQWAGAGVWKLQNGLNRAGGQRSLLWQQERLRRGVQVGVAGERCACFCGEEQEQRSGRKKIHLCCQIANQGLRSSTEGDEVFRLLKDSDTLIVLDRTKPVPALTLLASFGTADYENFQS
jgi:hypothetical protein